jgi:hypothetical protein
MLHNAVDNHPCTRHIATIGTREIPPGVGVDLLPLRRGPNSSAPQLLIDCQAILLSLLAVVYILENTARRTTLRASHQKRHHIEVHSDVHPDPHREVNAIAVRTLTVSIWHR